jgi:hypothetical protein
VGRPGGSYAAAAAELQAVREQICEREVALVPDLPGGGYLSESVNRRLRLLRSQVGARGGRLIARQLLRLRRAAAGPE